MPTLAANWLRSRGIEAGVIIGWPSTNGSIPVGWLRETSLDARFVKMVLNTSTNPGGTGGSASHIHAFSGHTHAGGAHTHTSANTSGENATVRNSQAGSGSIGAHEHVVTTSSVSSATSASNSSPTNWDSTSTEPPHLVVIFIRSTGAPKGFPPNAIAFFNAAAPTGWTAFANGVNRFWKGAAAAGDGGGTGGTGDVHTHTSAAHSHTSGGTHVHATAGMAGPYVGKTVLTQNGTGNFILGDTNSHDHNGSAYGATGPAFSGTASPTSASGDMTPPWKKLLTIQNTSGGELLTLDVIALWLGTIATIPTRWKICDGNNGTPNVLDLFIRGANGSGEVGNTGGAATHTHAAGGSHTHTVDAHTHTGGTTSVMGGGSASSSGPSGGNAYDFTHTHVYPTTDSSGSHTSGAQTVTASANSDNRPIYTDVAYIQLKAVN